MPQTYKTYLGDGAYAKYDNDFGEVTITTENGLQETNRIVLGISEYVALVNFVTQCSMENDLKVKK